MTTESNQADALDALDELNELFEARIEYCEDNGICIEEIWD
jgi:hypothetical protein